MPLERLTMLVVAPAERPVTLVVPRLEAAPARGRAADATVEIATWEETDDPYALVATAGLDRAAARAVAVSDTMLAMHVLRLQAALGPGAPFELASAVLRALRMVKDADEIALLRLRGPGRRPGRRPDRRRAARRADRGGRRARGPRAARRRGPRGGRTSRSSPPGPNSRVAAPRGVASG